MNNQKYSTLSDKPLPPLPQNNKSIEMDIQVPPVYDIDQLMVEQSNEFKSIDSVPFKSEKRISRCSLCKNDYWLLLFILGFIFPLFWIVLAAAATAVQMLLGCCRPPPIKVSITIDKPFFSIISRTDALPLFFSKVTHPKE
ncbi:hypothetical protein QTN25_009649 [Entamoeba marina]